MKEVPGTTSVDGENFASALEDGCLYSAKDGTPFQRGIGHILARHKKLISQQGEMGEAYLPYDEITPGFSD